MDQAVRNRLRSAVTQCRKALEDAYYVQARAAEQLGITKSLLQYKMKKYNLQRRKR